MSNGAVRVARHDAVLDEVGHNAPRLNCRNAAVRNLIVEVAYHMYIQYPELTAMLNHLFDQRRLHKTFVASIEA